MKKGREQIDFSVAYDKMIKDMVADLASRIESKRS